MTTTELKITCPECGYRMDAASGIGDADAQNAVPEAGAVSICIACGEPALFVSVGGSLALRSLTTEEYASVLENDDARDAMRAIKNLARMDPSWPNARRDQQ